jgi:CheY-like chemotaxis protein
MSPKSSAEIADILLIEDSPTTAELFAYALKANDSRATLRIVEDGEAALALLHDALDTPLPRLLVLDLHLPGLDGMAVLDRVRGSERTRHLPVVIYSASDLAADRAEALRRGANGFVRKPVGFQDARAAVARIERGWLRSEAAGAPAQSLN